MLLVFQPRKLLQILEIKMVFSLLFVSAHGFLFYFIFLQYLLSHSDSLLFEFMSTDVIKKTYKRVKIDLKNSRYNLPKRKKEIFCFLQLPGVVYVRVGVIVVCKKYELCLKLSQPWERHSLSCSVSLLPPGREQHVELIGNSCA